MVDPAKEGGIAYICPGCGTNLYNTSTGWLHYNTGTDQCWANENEELSA